MARNPIYPGLIPCPNGVQRIGVTWFMIVVWAWFCSVLGSDSPKVAWVQQATQAHAATEQAYRTNTTDVTLSWKMGRACYDLAEFASTEEQRAKLAQQGILACREALKTDPADAKVSYYLAMNLGQLARTKTLGALRLVKEMEELFEKARVLDESFDHAGPDRCLGLLYLEAPGWPTSIGNRKKAVMHFRRATELAPGYPENRLLLVKALLLGRDHSAAAVEWAATQESWSLVRTNFTGAIWEPTLAEWDKLRRGIERKLETKPSSP